MIAQQRRMTVVEFLRLADDREDRAELIDGVAVAMAPVDARHADVQGNVYVAMRQSTRAAGLACRVFGQALGVVFDERNLAIPDVFVTCTPVAPTDRTADPVIVVEVLSPTTRRADLGRKMTAYLTLPSLTHYLAIDPHANTVVHHRRTAAGFVVEYPAGQLVLDPPGLTLSVPGFFAA